MGYSANWVRSLVHRYNEQGEAALADGRANNAGKGAYLTPEQQAELEAALQQRPPDGGLWSGPKLTGWIREKTGRERVSAPLGWPYVRRLGFRPQRPRRRHVHADAAAQEAFKKS